VAASAGAGPILLEGLGTRVVADHRGSVESIWIGGREIGGPVRAAVGRVANVVAAPGAMKREWVGPGGPLLETVLASRRQPLVAVQWSGDRAPSEISVSLRPRAADPDVRLGSSRVDVADDEGTVSLAVHPPPDDLTITRAESGPVAIVRPAVSSDTTLLLAAGSPRTVDTVLDSRGGWAAQLALAQQGPDDGLRLLTGVGAIDDAVAWARSRLATALSLATVAATTRGPSAPNVLWATLAATAAGDRTAAGHGLDAMPPPPHGADAVERRAFASAAVLRTFGDPRPALEAARALFAILADDARGSQAARALAGALHGAAAPDLVSRLRTLAPTVIEPTAGPRSSGRALPMARTADAETTLGAWLVTLLDGEPTTPLPAGRSPAESALYGLVSGFRSTPEQTWNDWRGLACGGLQGGPFGPGTWDGPDGTDEASGGLLLPRTAALILSLTHGVLGLAPDARLGRVRIAPRIPRHLTRLRVDGITSGSTRLALDYAREGSTHAFELVPDMAAVPPMVVFEPLVYGAVRTVRIDGEAADLAVRQEGGSSVVPVQLPVDGVRRVEIETSRGTA
jgi:hypothetical protein